MKGGPKSSLRLFLHQALHMKNIGNTGCIDLLYTQVTR